MPVRFERLASTVLLSPGDGLAGKQGGLTLTGPLLREVKRTPRYDEIPETRTCPDLCSRCDNPLYRRQPGLAARSAKD